MASESTEHPPAEKKPGEKEPWDFEAFVRCYNERAREFGGWNYDRSSAATPLLQSWYEEMHWKTIREFAEAHYMSEQQY